MFLAKLQIFLQTDIKYKVLMQPDFLYIIILLKKLIQIV